MDKETVRAIKALLYIINILWAAFLIYESYQLNTNISTIFTTIIIMLSSMAMNDLLKFE